MAEPGRRAPYPETNITFQRCPGAFRVRTSQGIIIGRVEPRTKKAYCLVQLRDHKWTAPELRDVARFIEQCETVGWAEDVKAGR